MKTRHDSICDQFNRLFMTRVLLIMSVIMGFDYYSDKVSCMVLGESHLGKDFIHAACWISGFYIYEEMKTRLDKSSYYGIPYTIDNDGIEYDGSLCPTRDKNGKIPGCNPMTKVYYLQYQWMPFYVGSLAIFYYIPYIIFRMVNTDLVSLKAAITSLPNGDAISIIRNYFNYKVNPVLFLRLRICWNIFVKTLYILFSLITFYLTDYLLLNNFKYYGTDYLYWSATNPLKQHTNVKHRSRAKAGNKLLPSMGFCEIEEAMQETKVVFHNYNRFICEISPNILYQYILMVLWFFFVASIIISIVGLVTYILQHAYHIIVYCAIEKKSIYQSLTLRELEYLDYIKRKNLALYGDVMRILRDERGGLPDMRGDEFKANGVSMNTMFHNGHYYTRQESYKTSSFD